MDLFRNAKAVRLRSHHDKYLTAEEDEESVTQDRNGSSKKARWTVEFDSSSSCVAIRLRSCCGKYLTASNQPFLLGMTGCKVTQTHPRPGGANSSLDWIPIRDGTLLKLRTRYNNYLRANGGLPPWRNSVTHDVPHRTSTQDWILWEVDILEILQSDHQLPIHNPPSLPSTHHRSPSSPSFSRQESVDSISTEGSSPPKVDGRMIHYRVVYDDEGGGGDAGDGEEVDECCFTFKGNGVEELSRRLEEETGLDGIIVCTRSPLNGKLYPLRLQLPPNNATMHLLVVPSSSKVSREFSE